MTKWTPDSAVSDTGASGSSGSYLSSMSSAGQDVALTESQSYSAPSPDSATSAPSVAPMSAIGSISIGGSKKSYAMTKWTPGSAVSDTGASGSSGSYLSSMSGVAGDVAPTESHLYSAPSPDLSMTAPSVAPVVGIGSVSVGGAKKSYAMTKWTPGSAVSDTGASGSSGSYLSSMSGVARDVAPTESQSLLGTITVIWPRQPLQLHPL